jgi:dTDP-4-amino-4,6-dideoxygalactose transaminase
MSIPDTARHAAKTVLFEEYPIVGFNYRMTDIQAAVGRVQLKRLPEILRQRTELAHRYTRALRHVPGLLPAEVPADVRTNYQSYAVRVMPEYPLGRDELMQAVLGRGISTRRGIMNAHQEMAYADMFPQRLPHSEAVHASTILLPLYSGMTDEDQSYVIESLRNLGRTAKAG